MKRFLRILRNIFLTLFSLLLFLMLGLYLYYNHLEKNFLNETKARSQKSKAAFYESPVKLTAASQTVINLLPYPQKLEVKPGIYTFPEVLFIESPEEFKQQLLQLSQMAFPENR
ncbi:MAG: hypothetical protein HC905_24935 [Bacteroidales bacterium]|nr:hypothetical protein [Bacteroidales bacterium]